MPDVREKTVEMLGNLFCGDYGVNGCDSCKYNTEVMCSAYACADQLIANGVTIQRWIPVTERLPDLHTTVLVYDQESKRDLFWYDENGFNVVDEYGCTYPVKTVTHWMPLPEAPKGE